MTKSLPLSSVAKYSQIRIDSNLITVANYISVDNIMQNKSGIIQAIKLPTGNGFLCAYKKNNILVGNIRPYLKKIWFADKSGGSSSDVLNIEVKEGFDSKFIYYCLFRDDFFVHMMKGSKGSKMPRGDKDQVMDFPIPHYDLPTQKKISGLLSKIDQKIDINNKINSELETTAKLLYDYWFVQFDFPDENGKPYKSSDGKMVWNEELKREIPEGWEVKRMDSIFKFEKGIEPGSSAYLDKKEDENCINFIRVGDINSDCNTFVDFRNNNYVTVNKYNIVVTFDGSVGKLGFGLEGAISGGLRKIYDKENIFDNSIVYSIFNDKRIIATIHKYATGSILLHASYSIPHLKIPFDFNILFNFQEIIKPLYEKMVKNKIENLELVQLRDWLLPMLMNGQVRVEN